jgi:hypothetical protein
MNAAELFQGPTDVTFYNVSSGQARELLARAFEGSVTLREGEELDIHYIRHGMGREEALSWLQHILMGHGMGFTREHHEDGTTTLYPSLMP